MEKIQALAAFIPAGKPSVYNGRYTMQAGLNVDLPWSGAIIHRTPGIIHVLSLLMFTAKERY